MRIKTWHSTAPLHTRRPYLLSELIQVAIGITLDATLHTATQVSRRMQWYCSKSPCVVLHARPKSGVTLVSLTTGIRQTVHLQREQVHGRKPQAAAAWATKSVTTGCSKRSAKPFRPSSAQ